MDEYISKQDAVDLVNKISNLDLKAKGGICVSLVNLKKADVAPVVRCKDCKNWSREDYGYCFVHASYGMAYDDFCSYGERREE